eukprot:CAMPEP_0204891012 /NCGR_PEP_ID=MMETSP1349-20130617/26234_1 /ASSEMBLY_ACC=CAM_ASM_000710 /TAXON_ID=215587 /ORGANISM="Aplanochytrium stocchinoi, Strain GSBS06" /LENGTH=71 /DNA_ID=CAMNT_0052056081 /DNA_START=26 /DNA_END=238 /DNA_ORIENTATION=-
MQVGYSVYAPPFDRDEIPVPFAIESTDEEGKKISSWIQQAYDGVSLLTEGDLDARLISKVSHDDVSEGDGD